MLIFNTKLLTVTAAVLIFLMLLVKSDLSSAGADAYRPEKMFTNADSVIKLGYVKEEK